MHSKKKEEEYAPKNFLHRPSKHVKEVHFRNQVANSNIQERLNGEFRDREKIFGGLKKDDSPAITGIKLYHNYIGPHADWMAMLRQIGRELRPGVITSGKQSSQMQVSVKISSNNFL